LKKASKTLLNSTDLDSLGPCFAPNIPVAYFNSLSANDFYTKATYFQGIQFQPNNAWATAITNKIK
jgi:hypothetical protein